MTRFAHAVPGALLALLAACSGAPTPPDWQLNSSEALRLYEQYYLSGDTRASVEFTRGRAELARTGREDLVARAELIRCAVRTASLEFDDCPGFEALRPGAGAEEIAYADYLAGRGSRAAEGDPLSRLVAAGMQVRKGTVTPATMEQAAQIASAQGWRRPLLAWLGVLEKRARDGGDAEAANRIRRRMDLISGGISG
jgi:hypothetical protein